MKQEIGDKAACGSARVPTQLPKSYRFPDTESELSVTKEEATTSLQGYTDPNTGEGRFFLLVSVFSGSFGVT